MPMIPMSFARMAIATQSFHSQFGVSLVDLLLIATVTVLASFGLQTFISSADTAITGFVRPLGLRV